MPDSAAICVLPEVAIARAPFTDPLSVGVNVTDKVQVADFASAPPQGVLPLATAAKLALAPMPVIVIVPVPLLVTFTVAGALVAPRPVAVNVTEAGLNFSAGLDPPVAAPLRPTVNGLNSVLLLMASAPLMVASYCGVKVTVMVQFAPPANEVPQLPPVTA